MMKRDARLMWKPTALLGASLFFLAVGVFFSVAFLLIEPNKNWLSWICFIASLFWTGAALFGTIYSVRTRVEANEDGMRWRDWRGVWRMAKWEEIRDFYRRAKSETGSTHSVETAQGNFTFGLEGDGKLIAELIAERAANAPVREWEIKGERLIDEWPRRFEFWRPGIGRASIIAFDVLLASLGLVAALLVFRLPPRDALPPSVWFLSYVAPILLLPILPFLIWLFLFIGAKQARPFRRQSVEITPDGIVFNGATRVEASWSQVEAFNWIRRGKTRFLQLQTAGGTIEIPSFMDGFRSLCRIIERFCGAPILQTQDEEAMAIHSGQTASDGSLVFSFDNVGVRMFSQIYFPIGLALVCIPFLMRLADPQTPPRDEIPITIMGIVVTLLSLGWQWWLRLARLRLARDALEWHGPFLKRSVAWKDIESFGNTRDGSIWIAAQGKKVSLSFFLTMVAQRSRLCAEIEKRAFNAQGDWHREKPSCKT
ncbi:MAG: hypothetical protein KY445_05090 [Armatimonadetes bacterium]|nr:hypothetical protein [Armatimonadota bacterium]